MSHGCSLFNLILLSILIKLNNSHVKWHVLGSVIGESGLVDRVQILDRFTRASMDAGGKVQLPTAVEILGGKSQFIVALLAHIGLVFDVDGVDVLLALHRAL